MVVLGWRHARAKVSRILQHPRQVCVGNVARDLLRDDERLGLEHLPRGKQVVVEAHVHVVVGA